MTDMTPMLAHVRRPRLLVRAARHGLAEYNRKRDLKRIFNLPQAPAPLRALDMLISEEARLDEQRRSEDAAYSIARHVEVLIALMAEAQLAQTHPPAGSATGHETPSAAQGRP
jgi:hypothetical protein